MNNMAKGTCDVNHSAGRFAPTSQLASALTLRRTLSVIRPEDAREQRLPRLSLTEKAYSSLREDIIKARRRPESMLLEHELAEEYGMSKTPIREALRLLVNEGWVVVIPRKGYFVRPLRFEDVREIFALRQMIEPAIVVAAASRSTAEELDELERLVHRQAAAGDDVETTLAVAAAFHREIARLGGNQRAERVLVSLFDESLRLHYLAPKYGSRLNEPAEIEDHLAIVEAMRTQDAALAFEVTERHHRESLRQTMNGLAGVPDLHGFRRSIMDSPA